MTTDTTAAATFEQAALDRKAHVDAILQSPASKKIVVAGPGTGKTYLFRAALAGKTKCLTLTFVNALVEDLSLELGGLSEVKTLHSYARSFLRDTKVFPKLSKVVREDAKLLLQREIDFQRIFQARDDSNPDIEFYRARKAFYDDYYGFETIIYAAVLYLEGHRDRIPRYDQVLVDEFQDFNKLELSLIELLTETSPILLAGDDDQALYTFKGASPEHIRHRFGNSAAGYDSFSLPYCSRSTRVIIEAANDLLSTARAKGYLDGRIDKQFRYFECRTKNDESACNPRIVYTNIYATQIPGFIIQQLQEIAVAIKAPFSVLIIAPTKRLCNNLDLALRSHGFKAIEGIELGDHDTVQLLDGLKLLLEDRKSNLGWRIVAEHILPRKDFESLLMKTTDEKPARITDIIGVESRRAVAGVLRLLRRVTSEKEVPEAELDAVLNQIGVSPYKIRANALMEVLDTAAPKIGNPGLRKIGIKITTRQSSKGLSADYVFITHFDDRYFIKDHNKGRVSDQDICNFLVPLTRAKKKVFLMSTAATDPTFLTWIDCRHIQRLKPVGHTKA